MSEMRENQVRTLYRGCYASHDWRTGELLEAWEVFRTYDHGEARRWAEEQDRQGKRSAYVQVGGGVGGGGRTFWCENGELKSSD